MPPPPGYFPAVAGGLFTVGKGYMDAFEGIHDHVAW